MKMYQEDVRMVTSSMKYSPGRNFNFSLNFKAPNFENCGQIWRGDCTLNK